MGVAIYETCGAWGFNVWKFCPMRVLVCGSLSVRKLHCDRVTVCESHGVWKLMFMGLLMSGNQSGLWCGGCGLGVNEFGLQ